MHRAPVSWTVTLHSGQVPDVEALHAEAAEKYFKGDYHGAEGYYKKALALNPKHLRSLCNYGALLHNVRHDHDKVRSRIIDPASADCQQTTRNKSDPAR